MGKPVAAVAESKAMVRLNVLEINLKNLLDLLLLVEVVERVLLLLKAPERNLCSRKLLQKNHLEVSRPSFFRVLLNPPILDLIVEVVCLCFFNGIFLLTKMCSRPGHMASSPQDGYKKESPENVKEKTDLVSATS